MRRITTGGPVYYQFTQWAESDRLTHGIFTRLGGVSQAPWDTLNLGGTMGDAPEAIVENYRRVYAALGLDGARACTVWQVHSADTIVVPAADTPTGQLTQADGMITDRPGLPLILRFADCVPVLLYDPVRHVAGIVHAGWQGTVLGIVSGALELMQTTFGTQPHTIQAGIGPSIGPEQYQVGEEVVAAVQKQFGHLNGIVHRADDSSAYLDLWAANRLLLERAGITQIEIAEICTASRTDEFFSHRAEAGKTGRFCAVLALS